MMSPMDKIAALKKTQMFGSLAPSELKALSAVCVGRHLEKGEMLFSAGSEAKGLYVVVSGSLRAYRVNEGGREQVIHVEKAGSTLAEVPVFDDQPTPSSVSAEEGTEVLFIAKADVRRLCLKFPAIALSALKLLATRLRKTAALIESISLKEVDQRLAGYLWEESGKGARREVQLPSNTAIAARLGSVREVVSRAFSKLEGLGLVKVDRSRKAALQDLAGLKRLAEK
jgi:CRP-like cAMP-binding protein